MSGDGAPRGAESAPAVLAEGLTVAHDRHVALRDADLELDRGTVTALIGPNGSGKSTLLDAIAGLLPVASGRLEVLGRPPGPGAGGVAYVLQSTVVPEHLPMTVRDVVRLGRVARRGALGRLDDEDRTAVSSAIRRLDLGELTDRRLDELSGGQRQRALVAQGLAEGAELLLLDEPVTGLDLVSRQRILDVVAEERAAGRTVVVTTHDLDEAALADQVVVLAGRVVAAGPPDVVLVPEVLRRAYGHRLLTVEGGGALLLDDPHHLAAGHDHSVCDDDDELDGPTA